MRKIIYVLIVVVSITSVQKILARGAMAKLTFKVVNDDGVPVTNADFKVNFYDPLHVRMTGWDIKTHTDANGIVVIKDRAYDDMIYSVYKKNYYKTKGRYVFRTKEHGK